MNKADYDRVLHYTYRSQMDNLLILMVRTKDDILSKKIEHFLHAYYYQPDNEIVEKKLLDLLQYADYANHRAVSIQKEAILSL